MKRFDNKPDISPTTPYDPSNPDQTPDPVPLPPDSSPQPQAPVREPDQPPPIVGPVYTGTNPTVGGSRREILKISSLLLILSTRAILRVFLRMGVFGLFLLSALDSSFLVLPFGNDLLLIALVSSNRGSLVWLVYVVVSAIDRLSVF
jgi:hypothetical protein